MLHGRRPVRVRDLPAAGRPVTLISVKRVWRCAEPRCPKRTWTETSGPRGPRASLTERARAVVCRRVGEDGHDVAAVAAEYAVGWHTVMRAVRDHGQPLVKDPARLSEVAAVGGRDRVPGRGGAGVDGRARTAPPLPPRRDLPGARRRLHDVLQRCVFSDIPELFLLDRTLDTWTDELLATRHDTPLKQSSGDGLGAGASSALGAPDRRRCPTELSSLRRYGLVSRARRFGVRQAVRSRSGYRWATPARVSGVQYGWCGGGNPKRAS